MNLLEEAIIYATVMHQGIVRKFNGIPYILHPMEVAQTLSTMTVDEAYEILIKHGFKNNRGDGTINTKSVKAATIISPSGFMISLIEHIKK